MDTIPDDSSDELASLEAPSTVVEPSGSTGGGVVTPGDKPVTPPPARRLNDWLKRHLNVYLILFLILIIACGIIGAILYVRSNTVQSSIISQPLSQATLDQLATSDVNVGEPKHTLSVQSDTVFSGNVLIRDDLQIAGNLQVGSNLAIAGLRVTGNSTFDDVSVTKSLAVTGNGAIQGQLSIQKSLNVNGSGTFLGAVSAPSLNVGTLQLTGDLNLTHHLTAGGNTPSRSNGPAIGGGGTATVSGSDTAGSVTINTGSGPSAGCFVTVTFATKFNSTPHVSITPVGATGAGLDYYVNRTTSSFSICAASAPSSSTTYVFDYIALD